MIFLPGLGAYKENYIDFTYRISKKYQFIYILDLPQQGSKGNWTVGSMVDNLKEFLREKDNCSIKEIHLSGHSIGGVAILSFLTNPTENVENFILSQNDLKDPKISDKLLNLGFLEIIPETEKITKLFLYSPCDAFGNVFPGC